LAFAAVYNLSFTALAVQGRFTPLVCAIVMPGSSLLVILATARFMGRRP
jgi:cation transport ATPase